MDREFLKKRIMDMLEDADCGEMDLIFRFLRSLLYKRKEVK